jgi:hypothetical protein
MSNVSTAAQGQPAGTVDETLNAGAIDGAMYRHIAGHGAATG